MVYYLGIDVGTSSVKSLLMRADGVIIGTSQKEYEIIKIHLDYAEQDMELLWNSTKTTISDLIARYPDEMHEIQGISFSGQMHGLVMVDEAGHLLRKAIIWADQRSGSEISKIYSIVGKEKYQSVIMNSLSTGFLVPSLLWVKDHEPEVYEKISCVMLPKDYIRYRMCQTFGTDYSDASGTGILSVADHRWAYELIDCLGFRREIFPELHHSTEIAGEISKECSLETGLDQGIKVAYGGGDTMMQAVGNGIVTPGVISANIGTACQLMASLDKPVCDQQYRTNTFCHVMDGHWILMGANLSGGVSLKWLKKLLNMPSFDKMTELASGVEPGSDGLVFLPYLNGERTPYNDPKAKGIFFGLTLRHGMAHMIRSTMEGIIFNLKSSADIIKEMQISYNKVVASGGAARSQLFLQMEADLLDREIFVNCEKEQACMGAAITAAVSCGEYADYAEACGSLVKMKSETVLPNPENQKKYEEPYALFCQLYGHNKDLFDRCS